MAYDPKAIANFFLDAAEAEGRSLTPLQVIKLVFCAHGWYLGLTGNPLSVEPPQAWKYGPVFPSLYTEFRGYGNESITGRAMTYADYVCEPVPTPSRETAGNLCKFLEQVYRQYGKFSGSQLSTITHKQGSPWYKAWYEMGGKDRKNFVIPEQEILRYYRGLKEQNAQPRGN